MSVLAQQDIARRVSEALKASLSADADQPKVEISFAAAAAPCDEAVPVAPSRGEPEEDDLWVLDPEPVDGSVEGSTPAVPARVEAAPTIAVSNPVEPLAPVVTRPRRSRRRVTAAAALLVFAGLGIWAALASRSSDRDGSNGSVPLDAQAISGGGADTPTLRGTFTVWNGGTAADPCAPVRSGAEPIEGDAVRLRGTEGGRLIMGALGSGSPTAAHTGCSFPFVLRNIPLADKYVIAVSGQSSMILTHEQLAATHWRLSMSLGTPSAG